MGDKQREITDPKRGEDMAKLQTKDSGLVRDIQKVFLDDKDFLRSLVHENIQQILEAEFGEYLQALPYERTKSLRGYRRSLQTSVGEIELSVVRDRGGNFSQYLFSRYQRQEQALVLSLVAGRDVATWGIDA